MAGDTEDSPPLGPGAADATVEVSWLSGEVAPWPAGYSARELAQELARGRGLPKWASVRLFEGTAELACDDVVAGGRLTAVLSMPRLALSGGSDAALRLWDLDSGERLGDMRGHEGAVSALCADLAGLKALSGAHDGTLRLWDLVSMACDRTVRARDGPISALAANFGRGAAASCSMGSRVVRTWDLRRGECTAELRGHLGEVTALAIGAERSLLSASADRTLRVWSCFGSGGQAAPVCRAVLSGHTGAICAAAADFERARAASGSRDRSVRVWDLASAACIAALEDLSWPVYSIAADFVTGLLLAGSGQGALRVWRVGSPPEAPALVGHVGLVVVAADFGASIAVSGGDEGALKVWQLNTMECARTVPSAHAGPVHVVAL